MIKISVITCTFNAAEVLKRTLDSVFAQTYSNVEHIIIDGVSKDDTLAMATEYQSRSEQEGSGHEVIVVSEPDHGLYDAMNKGIAKATGDYVVFINAGDKFHSVDTLETVSCVVGDGETLPAVLYGDTDIVDDEGRFARHRRLAPPENLSWRSFRNGMLVCHQAFYARADIAKQNLYDLSYRYSADVDWCIRIMKQADKDKLQLRDINAVVVDYLEGGMTIDNHRASLMERFRLMRTHYGIMITVLMHIWFVLRVLLRK